MYFLVKNTSPVGTDASKTIFADSSVLEGQTFPIGPQETIPVPDTTKDMLVKLYPTLIQVVGPYTDPGAPVALTYTLTASWALVDLGKYCTQFKFQTVDTIAKVSFSGWDSGAGQTEPLTMYQVPIPADIATPGDNIFELNMDMNPSRYFYAKGTAGQTLTIYGY